jgi:large subunit ribosomal protein L29
MKVERLRELSKEELFQLEADLKEELFNLRMQRSSKEPDNPIKFRNLKRDIAKIKTVLREEELSLHKLASSTKQKPVAPKEKPKEEKE